ncbi:MAG: hypothetical protein HY884_04575 [Deltaproteobacteria bacterium]|nr:hypothetical protein [Deltaproteobacteria bacterium]
MTIKTLFILFSISCQVFFDAEATAKLRTCLFSDNEIDLRTALRDGSGDEVWKNFYSAQQPKNPKGAA